MLIFKISIYNSDNKDKQKIHGEMNEMLDQQMSEAESQEFYQKEAEKVPAQRIGQPIDIGHAAVFLMTNPFVNGTVLEVNRGWQLT